MSKNRDRGKSYERWIAQDLGGRRIGLLGMEDVILPSPPLSIECKEREKLPRFILKCLSQAKANCPDDKMAVVCLHELNKSHAGDVVLMEYPVFKTLIGRNK